MGITIKDKSGGTLMADIHQLAQYIPAVQPDQATSGPIIDTARIIRRDADEFLLLTSGTLALRAKKAAGCLLEPEANDTVLLVRNSPAGVFILTVLERGGADSRVVLPADSMLSTEDGKLQITADALLLSGKRSAALEAPEISVQGVRGDLSCMHLSLTASAAEAKIGKISLVSAVIDTISDRITQRVRDCFRRVSRMDSTAAGQVSIRTENRFDLKADAVSMVAECEVKIDGDKIHLG